MECTLKELRNKEVINIYNGERLGYIDDVRLNTDNNAIMTFIIYGREKLFGILGKQSDILIHSNQIHLVGDETILVSVENVPTDDTAEKRVFFHKFFV